MHAREQILAAPGIEGGRTFLRVCRQALPLLMGGFFLRHLDIRHVRQYNSAVLETRVETCKI